MSLVFRTVKQIPTQAIDVGDRQYPPTQKQVEQLARLLAADGQQLSPILVRPVTADTYKVVCGATRLKAARHLGWTHVKAQEVAGPLVDCQIAELADDFGSKGLNRKQRAEIGRKLRELRQQRAAAAGEVEKAKGGRGKRGGVAEAARQAGVAESTARKEAKKPRTNEQTCEVSDVGRKDAEPKVHQLYETCPQCKGKGTIPVSPLRAA